MKQFYIVVLSICVFFTSAAALHSQESVTVVDSLIIYKFTSLSDSVRYEKQITTRTDSVLDYTLTHTFRWNEGTAKWDNHERNGYFQDSWNNILSLDIYQWDGSAGEWFHSYKDSSSVDSVGNVLSNEAYIKSEADDPWFGISYISYEYDSAGNRTMETYSEWDDQTQIWVLAVRHVSEYDTKGRLTLKTNARWNVTVEQWEEYNRRSYEYTEHPDGSIASQITRRWNEGAAMWERSSMTTYEYNESGLLIREIRHDPVASGNDDEWHQNRKTEYNYDAHGNMILRIYFENTASYPEVVWEGTGTKSEYNYTPDGQLQLSAMYRWDDAGGDWKFNISNEYLFNVYGFRTTGITYKDEGAGADSVLTEKMFFYPTAYYFTSYDSLCEGRHIEWQGETFYETGTYEEVFTSVMGTDSTYTLKLMVHPNPGSFTITGDNIAIDGQTAIYTAPENAEVEYHWSAVNGTLLSDPVSDTAEVTWNVRGEGEISAWAMNIPGCSSDTASILVSIGSNGMEEFPEGSLVLYPVPVKDVLRVRTSYESLQLEVMDASGRMVVHTEGLEIDLSHLDSGIYLVRLRDRNGRLLGTQKVLKE